MVKNDGEERRFSAVISAPHDQLGFSPRPLAQHFAAITLLAFPSHRQRTLFPCR